MQIRRLCLHFRKYFVGCVAAETSLFLCEFSFFDAPDYCVVRRCEIVALSL